MKEEIERLIKRLKELEPGTKEYENVLDNLKSLSQIKKESINKEVITSLTQLTSLMLVLNYERIGILTSKAINFIKR